MQKFTELAPVLALSALSVPIAESPNSLVDEFFGLGAGIAQAADSQ